MKNEMKILVIDDDPDICTMIKMVLDYHGYTAMDADTEEKANSILGSNEINLIIMDMLLSGVDGSDICRRLKQNPRTASIPVLMFSAHPNAKKICIAAGADDFISKPFEMIELLEKITSHIGTQKVKPA